MGDMNYRINGIAKSVLQLMNKNMYEVLRYNDQLFIEMAIGSIPSMLKEGKIEFAPTYKRRANTNTEFAMSRTPSWTDRILFAFNPKTCDLSQKVYDANNGVAMSDHRPVFSQFQLTFDLCGDGFGKGSAEVEQSLDNLELSYRNEDLHVNKKQELTEVKNEQRIGV